MKVLENVSPTDIILFDIRVECITYSLSSSHRSNAIEVRSRNACWWAFNANSLFSQNIHANTHSDPWHHHCEVQFAITFHQSLSPLYFQPCCVWKFSDWISQEDRQTIPYNEEPLRFLGGRHGNFAKNITCLHVLGSSIKLNNKNNNKLTIQAFAVLQGWWCQ